MVIHISHVATGLVTSSTINVLGFLYFAIYICLAKVFKRCKCGSTDLVLFHTSHSSQLRITYLNVIIGLVLPILAVVVTFTSGILTNRLKISEVQIQVCFSIALGVFVFMLALNSLVKSQNRSVEIVYNIIAIATFLVALCIQEEPFIGLIVMTSQGSRSTNHLQRLMKKYWKRETPCCSEYGVVVFVNTVFTVIFNGIIPLLYLLSTIMQTYSMNTQLSSPSIGCFYAFLVFFSFMNGWALCAVTDEAKQYLRRKKTPPSYRATMRSPAGPLRIVTTEQAQRDRCVQFSPLPGEILPPPSYSQVVNETKPIITCFEKTSPVDKETIFVSVPLNTP